MTVNLRRSNTRLSRFHQTAVRSSWAILAAGLVMTALVTYAVHWNFKREALHRFDEHCERIEEGIRRRIERYQNALIQTRALFISHGDTPVSREQFRLFVAGVELIKRYPGIQGIGFAKRVSSKDLPTHTHAIRKEGFPNYQVWPETNQTDRFPIVYLEPFDWRNQRAFGFDMFTEETRREAMNRAIETGQLSTSGRVKLVQETQDLAQPGFLIYLPIFRSGLPVDTIEQRKRALLGFIYSPFRAHDLFEAIFSGQHIPIDFEVFDGSQPALNRLLFDSDGQLHSLNHTENRTFERLIQVNLGGRNWTIFVSAKSNFAHGLSRFAVLFCALSGMLVTLLVFRSLRTSALHQSQLHASYEGEKTARIETESFVKKLEGLNQISRKISGELDLQKLVQEVTDAATELSGAQFGALFYNLINEKGESYTLYTISGAPREAFSTFPMPRNTEVFGPTFTGARIVRSDDIRADPHYGKNAPYNGMPEGHLPVVSYLAVPVISRTGEVLGGLFFGHPAAGRFTEHEERLVSGLAAQAAVAIDNARLYQRARDAVAVRDEFISICSHELKTPLTSLKLQTQISKRSFIAQGLLAPERINHLIDTTDRQVARLNRLVDDMLDVSRLATGKFRLEMEHFDLVALVHEVVERLSEQARLSGSSVHIESAAHVMGTWDRFRLDQVITNIVTNALKYGAGKPIEISISEKGNEALLKVRDQGMGIAPEDHQRIFERFERAVTSNNISGLGLGLYITHQIIKAHQGSIRVESAPNQGATFAISLPVHLEVSDDFSTGPARSNPTTEFPELRS